MKARGRLSVLRDDLVAVRAVEAHRDALLVERDVAVVDEVLEARARIVLGDGPAEVAEVVPQHEAVGLAPEHAEVEGA
eukprot:14033256-Alexandrium_andersonii.AAC.1